MPPTILNSEEPLKRMPGTLFFLEIFSKPVRHGRIINRPRLNLCFAFFPITLITIKELMPVALVFRHRPSLQAILITEVVLLAMTFPLIRRVDRRHISLPSK